MTSHSPRTAVLALTTHLLKKFEPIFNIALIKLVCRIMGFDIDRERGRGLASMLVSLDTQAYRVSYFSSGCINQPKFVLAILGSVKCQPEQMSGCLSVEDSDEGFK